MPSDIRFLVTFRGCRGPISAKEGFKTHPMVIHGKGAGVVIKQDSHYINPDGSVNFRLDLGRSHFSGTTYLEGNYLVADLTVQLKFKKEAVPYRLFLKRIEDYFKPTEVELEEIAWK